MQIEIMQHEPPYRVGVIVGSLSRESINRRLADALTHAVEAYVSNKSNPFADAFSLTAISTIGR